MAVIDIRIGNLPAARVTVRAGDVAVQTIGEGEDALPQAAAFRGTVTIAGFDIPVDGTTFLGALLGPAAREGDPGDEAEPGDSRDAEEASLLVSCGALRRLRARRVRREDGFRAVHVELGGTWRDADAVTLLELLDEDQRYMLTRQVSG